MKQQPVDLLIDLASEACGGQVLAASDELLGPKEGLLHPSGPGWETRRRHAPGHDWAIVALGLPGVIRHSIVDTTGFAGRNPTHASVESIHLAATPDIIELVRDPGRWTEIVSRSPLAPDSETTFAVQTIDPMTHVRLVVYPDGGIEALRVVGDPTPPDGLLDGQTETDVAALASGARAIDCSGPYFSSPNNMLSESAGGWLTHRRRDSGHEWAIIRLAGRATVNRIELDTTGLAGNAPESIAVAAVDAAGANRSRLRKSDWRPMLAPTQTEAETVATYTDFETAGSVTHLRLDLHPDGGVSRLRVFGVSQEPWISPS